MVSFLPGSDSVQPKPGPVGDALVGVVQKCFKDGTRSGVGVKQSWPGWIAELNEVLHKPIDERGSAHAFLSGFNIAWPALYDEPLTGCTPSIQFGSPIAGWPPLIKRLPAQPAPDDARRLQPD